MTTIPKLIKISDVNNDKYETVEKIFNKMTDFEKGLIEYCVYLGNIATSNIIKNLMCINDNKEYFVTDEKKIIPLCKYLFTNIKYDEDFAVSENGCILTFIKNAIIYKITNVSKIYLLSREDLDRPTKLMAMFGCAASGCAIYKKDIWIPENPVNQHQQQSFHYHFMSQYADLETGIIKFSESDGMEVIQFMLHQDVKHYCKECIIVTKMLHIDNDLCEICFKKSFNCEILKSVVDIKDHNTIVLRYKNNILSFKNKDSAMNFWRETNSFMVYEIIHRLTNIHPFLYGNYTEEQIDKFYGYIAIHRSGQHKYVRENTLVKILSVAIMSRIIGDAADLGEFIPVLNSEKIVIDGDFIVELDDKIPKLIIKKDTFDKDTLINELLKKDIGMQDILKLLAKITKV